MISKAFFRCVDQISASWKFCLSFRKHDWTMNDYPISIREHEPDPAFPPPRFSQHRYWARIMKWSLSGSGNTRHEAIENLKSNFETARIEREKQGKLPPRPGTRVPIEFAPQEQVSRHPELADDFMLRIFDLGWFWISDESSLWDFHTDESNERLYAKITEAYGVDVSDIQSAKLSEIFDRIALKPGPKEATAQLPPDS